MAPVQSRQVVVWLVPSLAILLSFLWYRRKKNGPQSDPGEVRSIPSLEILSPVECAKETEKTEEIATANKMNRTLLGAESLPIDIILPHELKAERTPPSIISDSDLDYEIEKMKLKKKSPIVKSLSKNKVNSVLSLQLQQVKSLSSVSISPNKVFESTKDIENKNSVNEERSLQNDTDIVQNGIVAAKNCIDKVQNGIGTTQTDCDAVEESRNDSLWVDIIDNSNETEEAIEDENESNVEETKNELAAAKTDVSSENCKTEIKTPQVETMETFVQRVCDKLEVAPKKAKKKKRGKNRNRNNNNIVVKTGATSFSCEAPKTASKQTPKNLNKSGNGKNVKARESMAVHRRLECDSANSSPECCITASSSLHSISTHSVDSNDSGKGGSDMVTTRGEDSIIDEAVNDIQSTEMIIYEFDIPQHIVGLLIGRRGAFINHIKSKSKTKIIVKEHPFNQDLRICSVEGLTSDIHLALNIIREKFPTGRFADLTLEQINFMPAPSCTILNSGLPLVEGINNDTKVSYVVSPVQMFLYQPSHPSYPRVQNVILRMTELYNNHETPLVPTPIKEWSIVAAPLDDSWQRALALSSDEESNTTLIRYMDIGGYANVENTLLRQLRPEFTCWPFQATEVFLANLVPIEDQTPEMIEHAFEMIDTLTGNYFLQTQIVSYTEDGVPIVFIYVIVEQTNILFLNREIAAQGLATWVDKYKVTS